MYSHLGTIEGLSVALVVLILAIFQSMPTCINLLRNLRKFYYGQDETAPPLVSDFILRCTYIISILLAVGIVAIRLRPPSQSDRELRHTILLFLLAAASRVHIIGECQLLLPFLRCDYGMERLLWMKRLVWMGWAYCAILLGVLLCVTIARLDQSIPLGLCLIFSFIEYFIFAFGYFHVFYHLHRRKRITVYYYTNFVSCILAGLIVIVLTVLHYLVNADLLLFEINAILTGILPIRFLLFHCTRETEDMHSTLSLFSQITMEDRNHRPEVDPEALLIPVEHREIGSSQHFEEPVFTTNTNLKRTKYPEKAHIIQASRFSIN